MTNLLLIILYAIQEAWPPASKFLAADVPDLSGKVFLVTGGNAGIGAFVSLPSLPLALPSLPSVLTDFRTDLVT